jgi:hypothetical protein
MDKHENSTRRSARAGVLMLLGLAVLGSCLRDARAHSRPPLLDSAPHAAARATGDRAISPEGAAPPACIHVRTEARYVPFGYNHVVVLESRCAAAAICSVVAELNPTPIRVEVPAGATEEVTTFIASPASSFVALVECELQRPASRGIQ